MGARSQNGCKGGNDLAQAYDEQTLCTFIYPLLLLCL